MAERQSEKTMADWRKTQEGMINSSVIWKVVQPLCESRKAISCAPRSASAIPTCPKRWRGCGKRHLGYHNRDRRSSSRSYRRCRGYDFVHGILHRCDDLGHYGTLPVRMRTRTAAASGGDASAAVASPLAFADRHLEVDFPT